MARVPEPFELIMKHRSLLVLRRYLIRNYHPSFRFCQSRHFLDNRSWISDVMQRESGDHVVEGLIWKWLSATFCKQEGRVIVYRLPFSMLSRPAKHFSRDIGPNDKTLRLVSEFDRDEARPGGNVEHSATRF